MDLREQLKEAQRKRAAKHKAATKSYAEKVRERGKRYASKCAQAQEAVHGRLQESGRERTENHSGAGVPTTDGGGDGQLPQNDGQQPKRARRARSKNSPSSTQQTEIEI